MVEDFPRTLAEFEARFSTEEDVVTIFLGSDGRKASVVRDVRGLKHGLTTRPCCGAHSAIIKPRSRRGRFSKTHTNR